VKNSPKFVPIDVEKLNRDIEANIEDLCRHFFPEGKKIQHEWCIGDVSGAKGKSLKIELVANGKKGLYHDWATDHKGNLVTLLQDRYGGSFPEVVQKIGDFLGAGYFLTLPADTGRESRPVKHRFKTSNSQKPPRPSTGPSALSNSGLSRSHYLPRQRNADGARSFATTFWTTN
jgi:hypothetical protein